MRLVDQPLDLRVGDGGALLPDFLIDEGDGDGQVFALLFVQRRPGRAAVQDGVVPIDPDLPVFSAAALTAPPLNRAQSALISTGMRAAGQAPPRSRRRATRPTGEDQRRSSARERFKRRRIVETVRQIAVRAAAAA